MLIRKLERNPESAADDFSLNFDHGLLPGDISNRFVSAHHDWVGRTMLILPDTYAKLVATQWCDQIENGPTPHGGQA